MNTETYINNKGVEGWPVFRGFEFYLYYIMLGTITQPFHYFKCIKIQRERGQWAVNYTSPQIFMILFSYTLAYNLG